MKKLIIFITLLLISTYSFAQSNLKPKDYQSIQNVLAQWNQTQDDGNLNGFMELWTKSPNFKNPFGHFMSTKEIMAFEQNYLSGFANGKRHMTTNTHIASKNHHTAQAIVDFMVVEVKEIPYVAATVRANISLKKEKGNWKIKSVVLAIDEGFNKLMSAK